MKKSVIILFAVVALFSMAQVAGAYDGQLILGSSYGPYETNNGGEFTFQVTGGLMPLVNSYALTTHNLSLTYTLGTPNFQTFCLEKNEYISAPGTYNATLNLTGAATAGGIGGAVGGSDPISQGTQYLYQQFAMGTLGTDLATYGGTYNYSGSGRLTSAADLQNAIWFLEGEGGTLITPYADLLSAKFGTHAGDTTFGGDYGVWALNLYDANGGLAQDQLIWDSRGSTVPEPGSMLLLGFGLLGLFGAARRRVK